MPSSLNSSGRMRTAASLKTNVLKKDIAAETPPLFRAVKNDEAKTYYDNSSENRPYSVNDSFSLKVSLFLRSKMLQTFAETFFFLLTGKLRFLNFLFRLMLF